MNRRTIGIASLVIIALLIIGAVVYAAVRPSQQLNNASTAPANATLAIGQAAPEFTLPSTAGTFDLDAQTKPALIEIFATWCPHCQRETVVMNQLYAAYKNRVAFLAVPGSDTGMDGSSPESQFDVINFQIKFNVKYPIAAYDPNLVVAKQYLQGGYPTIVIVNAQHKITYLDSGEVPFAKVAAALDASLK